MSALISILEHNHSFVENKEYEQYQTTKYPNKKMVILTCMDTRLHELLSAAMNLKNGDAKIIRNAGAVVSHPYGSIMRSIIIALYELNAREVYVIGHHDCGMASLDSTSILDKYKQDATSEDQLNVLENEGNDLKEWLTGFNNVEESVRNSVEMIRKHPIFPPRIPVDGLVIDPETGQLDLIVNGND